jgi:S-adenosylmethionine synthetase
MPPAVRTKDDWSAIKATAVSLDNVKAAAELHGVNPKTAQQRAYREKWPIGYTRRPAAIEAAQSAQRKLIAKRSSDCRQLVSISTEAAQSMSTTEALINQQAEDGQATRLASSRYARRVIEYASKLRPEKGLQRARAVKDAVDVAAKSQPGWEQNGQLVTVNVAVL